AMFKSLRKQLTPPEREESGARTVEERRAVLAEIAVEDAGWAERATLLGRRITEAQERVSRAEEFLAQARAHLAELDVERLQRSLIHESRIGQLRRRLQLGASPLVASFIQELLALEEQARSAFQVRTQEGPSDPATDHRLILVSTNNAEKVVE